jgi:hypothetical protein
VSTASGVSVLLRHWADLARQLPKHCLQSATDASREQFAAMLGRVSRLLTIEGASAAVASSRGCSSQMLRHFSRPGPRRSECGYVSSALNRGCFSFSAAAAARSRSTASASGTPPGSGLAATVNPVAPSPRRAHWQRAVSWTCTWSPSRIGPTRPPGEAPCLQVLVVLPSR